MTELDAVKALSARADKLAGEDELSGAVLVAKDDRVLFSHAYGLADHKNRVPNTSHTRFRIRSMNKTFTAVAILQLVEAGKVKLTAPLGTYRRDYPNREVATKVTIHQLLTHTGGTGDIFGPDFDAHPTTLRTLADYVKLYGKRGLEFVPDSPWAYSNYGFIRRRHREGDRAQLLRVRAAARLRARRDDQERIAARTPSGPGPVDRIHEATRSDRVGLDAAAPLARDRSRYAYLAPRPAFTFPVIEVLDRRVARCSAASSLSRAAPAPRELRTALIAGPVA